MKPSEKQKEIYKKLSPILGVNPKVVRYGDESSNQKSIFILECPDPIDSDIMFYGTIGLSDFPVDETELELLFATHSDYSNAGNILSSCAFFVINDNWKPSRGACFETLIEMYYPNLDMKHIYFSSPYLWEDKLENFEIQGKRINFLLAIPISQTELLFKNEFGEDKLEELFESNDTNIFDLNRKSIV